MAVEFASIPAGSLAQMPDDDNRAYYVHWVLRAPDKIQGMLTSDITGSFIQGLVKRYALPPGSNSKLAFLVVRLAVGGYKMTELANVIAAEFKVPQEKAQAIAKEIEKELFVPYMLEYGQWLKQLHQKAEGWEQKLPQTQAGVQNVVDLKSPPKPKSKG